MGCCGSAEKEAPEEEEKSGPDSKWEGVYGEGKHKEEMDKDKELAENNDLVTFVNWKQKGHVAGERAAHNKGEHPNLFEFPTGQEGQGGASSPRSGVVSGGSGNLALGESAAKVASKGESKSESKSKSKKKKGPTITDQGAEVSFDQMVQDRKRVSKTDDKVEDKTKPTREEGEGEKDLMGTWQAHPLADPTWKAEKNREIKKRQPSMEIGISIPEKNQEEDLFRVGSAPDVETDADQVKVEHVLVVPAKKYRGPPPLTPYPEPPKAIVVTSMASPKGGWEPPSEGPEGGSESTSSNGFLSYIPVFGDSSSSDESGKKKHKKRKKSKKSKKAKKSKSSKS